MTNEQEKMLESLRDRIEASVENCEPKWNGEPQDWFSFSTEDMHIDKGVLTIYGNFYEYIYTPSEW
jgi:hypothetical protein